MSTDGFVLLSDLAETMGVDRSTVHKYARKNGFKCVGLKTPKSRGAAASALSNDQAARLLELRRNQGFTREPLINRDDEDVGVFYIIQLVPELEPRRVKFGFAGSLDQRVAQHRTSAPTCAAMASWPCRKAWEQTVIAALTATGCRLVLNEVYEVDDLDALVDKGSDVFSRLPPPDFSVPLASSSPLGIHASGQAGSDLDGN